ncbi:MAG: hypothetical protein ACE5EH_07865 [Gammaproteobacteria bacterium]
MKLNLVIALPCEARPLIKHFRLRNHHKKSAFKLYSNDDGISLIISGAGKFNATAATALLHGLNYPETQAAWLNLGIAGNSSRDVGDAVLANKVIDWTNHKQWYPTFVFPPPCKTDLLITVEEPETSYQEQGLYDMEASGFFHAASRFSLIELVHSLKVVSDNQTQSTDQITKDFASKLIENQLSTIACISDELLSLANELSSIYRQPRHISTFMKNWHFTHYQRHQLDALLRRWETLYPDLDLWNGQLSTLKNSEDVLNYLESRLMSVADYAS